MAEVLTLPDDEILFVDYNTPDDFPTFPEAVRDTLTPRAQHLLRILRVRPAQHARFQDRTHLKALEPISRNVALRRSNPRNRWILSTNTDMIFVPRGARSLSGTAESLEGGFYHLPRFEVPEYLWETLNRYDPAGVIALVERWGWSLHLNEVVTGLPTNRYDGPGDFQLGLREDLFRVHGFDERMLIGWHVDSNIAARMSLLYGRPDTLVDDFFGYHCDHTRQVTPAHSHNRTENDWRVYVTQVQQAEIPSQAETWGLAGEVVEEVHLTNGARVYLHALHKAVGEPMRELTTLSLTGSSYDRIGYDSRHVLPFLLDAFTAYPQGVTVAWFGARGDLLLRFATAWRELGQTGEILVPRSADWLPIQLPPSCRPDSGARNIEAADILVFDFGLSALRPDDEPWGDRSDVPRILRLVEVAFLAGVAAERERLAKSLAPRRLIAVNAINNRFSTLVDSNIAITLAPIATRLRQGFVLPATTDMDLLPVLFPGDAAEALKSGGIATKVGQPGLMLFGIYRSLPGGWYRITLSISYSAETHLERATRPLRVEIVGGRYRVAAKFLSVAELRQGKVTCLFKMPDLLGLSIVLQPVQLLIFTDGNGSAQLTAGRLERMDDSVAQPTGMCEPLEQEVAWLPMLMQDTQAAAVEADGLNIAIGDPHYVVHGPYYPLMPGCYEALFSLIAEGDSDDAGFIVDVVAPAVGAVLAQSNSMPSSEMQTLVLPFEITGDSYGISEPQPIEFRLFTHGKRPGKLLAVTTRRLHNPAHHPAILHAADF